MSKALTFILLIVLTSSASSAMDTRHSKKTARRGGTVVLIPDQKHGSQGMFRYEIMILKRVGNEFPNKTKCLFLEVDTSFDPAIRAYLNRQKNYQDSVMAAVSSYKKKWGFAYTNLMPELLLSEAAQDRFQVFGMDHLQNSSLGSLTVGIMSQVADFDAAHLPYPKELTQRMAKFAIEARSAEIAGEVARTYSVQQCDVAVMVIGATHTKEWVGPVSVIPIQSRLTQQGLITTVLETSDLK